MSEDNLEEYPRTEGEPLLGGSGETPLIVIPGGLGNLPERKPPTLKQVAWGLVWSMAIFFVVVAVSAAIITWLWNSNLSGVNGLPSIDLRTAASVVILIKLAAFLWKGHR